MISQQDLTEILGDFYQEGYLETDCAEELAVKIISRLHVRRRLEDASLGTNTLAAFQILENFLRKDPTRRDLKIGHYYVEVRWPGCSIRRLSDGKHMRLIDALIRVARDLVESGPDV